MVDSGEVENRQLLLEANGASPDIARIWAGHIRPYLEFDHELPSAKDLTRTGATKLGGIPDGPEGAQWPVRGAYAYKEEGNDWRLGGWRSPRPLAFLAQVNLADMTAAGGCGLPLPEAGLLQVFYDTEVQPWGFDPSDRPGFRMIYVPPDARLTRMVEPESDWPLHGPVAPAHLSRGFGLPGWEWMELHLSDTHGWDRDRIRNEMDQIAEKILFATTRSGRLLGGWPDLVQGPIEEQCELVSNGIYCGDSSGYESEAAQALKPNARLWRQVVQLPDDEDLEWQWGMGGTIYAMARDQDIAARAFERAHLVLQTS